MQSQGESKPRVKRFPTTPNLDQWLSHSVIVPMASGPEDSFIDDTTSSLGDSTYDFLDDKSGFTTDDEDTSNLTQSVSSSKADHVDLPAIQQSQDTARPFRPVHSAGQAEEAEEASTEGDQGNMVDDNSDIKLDEPFRSSLSTMPSVEGSHTLRIFDDHEMREMFSIVGTQAPRSQLRATVRQTMAGHTLSLGAPFRLLYVGEAGAKDAIVQKIGSALIASSGSSVSRLEKAGSSRFNIVPISSFGETRSPEVLLVDSLGIEINVDHCSSATFSRKEDGNDSVSLQLSSGMLLTSTWSSHDAKFSVSTDIPGWELPHIAVFYMSEPESMDSKQTRRFARSFMSRHKIPCLVITQGQLWNRPTEAITLDYLTPHLCLEISGMDNARPRIIKRLPIDLATFLNLDAVQVNRNLACLTDVRATVEKKSQDLPISNAKSRQDPSARERSYCYGRKVGHDYSTWSDYLLENVRLAVKSPFLGLVVLALTFSCLGMRQYLAYCQSGSVIANVPAFPPLQPSSFEQPKLTTKANTARVELTPTHIRVPSAPLSTASPKAKAGIQSNTDLASFLLDTQALTSNNSANFQVHVVGDRHVVLRPPHWFMRYRKAPKLSFSITRMKQPVKYELSILFDGVYALKVPREEAYGVLNVSVRTASKPMINETFQVDFGNTWLRVASWKNAARTVSNSILGDIKLVQRGLSIIHTNANTEVQRIKQDVVKKVETARGGLDWIRLVSSNRTAMATRLVQAQTKGLSRAISKRFSSKGTVLTKQLSIHSQHVRGDLNNYIGNRAAAFKNAMQIWVRSIHGIDYRSVRKGVGRLGQDHLRSTQKEALKAWWKLVGVPRQAFRQSAVEEARRKRGVRSGKKGNAV